MMGKIGEKIMLEEIGGVTYVYVPRDVWDKIWEILDRI